MGKPGGANPKKVAREVLLQDHEGHHAAALHRADALALAHPTSALAHFLAGHLHLFAAMRARHGDATTASTADAHLASARAALSAARQLVPYCVEIATALGDALAESSLLREAEAEYRRAIAISAPVDPAKHNAAYGMRGGGPDTTTADDRVQGARARARRSYDRLRNRPVAAEVGRVLALAARDGAHAARPHAKRVAEHFPTSARAQLLEAYVDLLFVRGLDAAPDKRACLRRPLASVDSAAQSFPSSVVVAAFRAKLLFLLGEHDAAESECVRALAVEIPHDPDQECVPLGSVTGADPVARLVWLSRQLRELLLKIIALAEDYWNSSMTAESRSGFMCVRLDTLQEEYNKVDPPSSAAAFTVSDALSFLKEHKSWRFWVCPFCDDPTKHTDTASLLDHLCSQHQKKVIPRLKSILDPKTVLEGDASFGGVTFSKDSKDQHDVMRFRPRNDIFRWMFCGPNRRIVAPRPFGEIRQEKCKAGILLLEIIRKKLAALPTDTSSSKYAMTAFEIQEDWLNFVERSVLDYRQVILTLARSFLWRELKKHMAEDPKVAARRISAADIDAVFDNATTEDHVTTPIEERAEEKDYEGADNQKTELHKVQHSCESSHSEQALNIHGDHQQRNVTVDNSIKTLAPLQDNSSVVT